MLDEKFKEFPENSEYMIRMKIQYCQKRLDNEKLALSMKKNGRSDSGYNVNMYLILIVLDILILSFFMFGFNIFSYLSVESIGSAPFGILLMMPFCLMMFIVLIVMIYHLFKNVYFHEKIHNVNVIADKEDNIEIYKFEIARLEKLLEEHENKYLK